MKYVIAHHDCDSGSTQLQEEQNSLDRVAGIVAAGSTRADLESVGREKVVGEFAFLWGWLSVRGD